MAMRPLDLQPWLTAPASRAVLAALAAERATPRFVGGCVRDAVLGRSVQDLDIATPDQPATVLALLAAPGLNAAPTALEHAHLPAVPARRRRAAGVNTFG